MYRFFPYCGLANHVLFIGMALWIWHAVSRAIIDLYSRCFAYVGILYKVYCDFSSQEPVDDLFQSHLRCVRAMLDYSQLNYTCTQNMEKHVDISLI
ncbi:hypothetical protein QR685DRAFT_271712 [Neurospora intermedia]|uniref:Secreted protein n=1 Tax=Neurospora intermedia TaxID=5142 RepID=A0ABR3DEB4_NEUIN